MKIKVLDINCTHCVQKIQKALLANGIIANISLVDKTVSFTDKNALDTSVKIIKDLGYTIENV